MARATEATIRVEGLRELDRAFREADKDIARDFRRTLRQAAEPVRVDAEALSVAGIRRITPEWARMRVGSTSAGVYLAPKSRSVRGRSPKRRPNLADLLMGRAMEPALERNSAEVERRVDRMLAGVERDWGSGG